MLQAAALSHEIQLENAIRKRSVHVRKIGVTSKAMSVGELQSADVHCSPNVLAAVIGISTRHLRRLTVEGILPLVRRNGKKPRYQLDESVKRFLKYQRDYIAATMSSADGEYRDARTRRMSALAQNEELEVKLKQGELLYRDDVDFWITNVLTAFKSRIQSIPSRVSRLVLGKSDLRVVHDVIETETNLALTELSNLKVAPRTEAADDSNASVDD